MTSPAVADVRFASPDDGWAIRLDDVAVRYRVPQGRVTSLKEYVLGRAAGARRPVEVAALRGVTLEVARGQAIGVIGPNGSGKSTLLRLIARVLTPTSGRVRTIGRVAPILDVVGALHPDLTGRENIFLNGAILGMTKRDIQRHFDEIVDFAEVEQFLDTPVKRYSSGMYMRLAFAVAAHLEPEVLVVDEVLAVGDAAFQKKCLGKMGEVASGGRTVLFVSHNMAAVNRICTSALLLNHGALIAIGPTSKIVSQYQTSETFSSAIREFNYQEDGLPDAAVYPLRIECSGSDGVSSETFRLTEPITVTVRYLVRKEALTAPALRVFNEDNAIVFTSHDTSTGAYTQLKSPGIYESTATIQPMLLNEGMYSVLLSINVGVPLQSQVYEPDALTFQVVEDLTISPLRQVYTGPVAGIVRPELNWRTHGPTPV